MPINAWTDGACSGNPGPGGWAYIIQREGRPELIASGYNPDTTNNQMELRAVLEVVKHPLVTSQTVVIHTDSEGVINWLSGTWKRNHPVIDGLCKLIQCWIKDNNVTLSFVKVKGHSTDIMNQRVDKLAVQAYLDNK